MRARHAEHSEHGISHEPLEQALVPRDLLGETVERPSDNGLDDLGVLLFGERGRANQISEERSCELAFLPMLFALT